MPEPNRLNASYCTSPFTGPSSDCPRIELHSAPNEAAMSRLSGKFDPSNPSGPGQTHSSCRPSDFIRCRRIFFRGVYEKPLEPQRQVLIGITLAYRWPVSTVSWRPDELSVFNDLLILLTRTVLRQKNYKPKTALKI